MKTGVECEWMFLDAAAPRTTAGLKISDPKDVSSKPCYDSTALMRRFDVITELMDAMESLGWGEHPLPPSSNPTHPPPIHSTLSHTHHQHVFSNYLPHGVAGTDAAIRPMTRHDEDRTCRISGVFSSWLNVLRMEPRRCHQRTTSGHPRVLEGIASATDTELASW